MEDLPEEILEFIRYECQHQNIVFSLIFPISGGFNWALSIMGPNFWSEVLSPLNGKNNDERLKYFLENLDHHRFDEYTKDKVQYLKEKDYYLVNKNGDKYKVTITKIQDNVDI